MFQADEKNRDWSLFHRVPYDLFWWKWNKYKYFDKRSIFNFITELCFAQRNTNIDIDSKSCIFSSIFPYPYKHANLTFGKLLKWTKRNPVLIRQKNKHSFHVLCYLSHRTSRFHVQTYTNLKFNRLRWWENLSDIEINLWLWKSHTLYNTESEMSVNALTIYNNNVFFDVFLVQICWVFICLANNVYGWNALIQIYANKVVESIFKQI